MWRKSLHAEIGLFDEMYKSAGDFDFWIRCLERRKVFYKINDPHITYFVNPKGLSTRSDTPGAQEANAIAKKHYRALVSEAITMSDADFLSRLKSSSLEVQSPRSRYGKVQTALRHLSTSSRANSKAEELSR